jgi:uncharacterized membrane-anchored protein YhcB (DUF1043 family)
MLKDFHEKRRKMSSERTKDLSAFSNNLATDTKKIRDQLLEEHRKMSSEQAKDLSDFMAALTETVKHLIDDFRKEHRRMSADRRHMGEDVKSMVNGFRKTRGETSAELRSRRERDAKNIEAQVKNKLKEFEESHAGMSDALRKSLAAYVTDMARGVRKLLQEYSTDMMQARKSWKTTHAGIHAETATPSVEMAGKVTTVREAIEEKGPQAGDPHHDNGIEEKVLGYINGQRNGIKVGDMKPALGIPKLRLGVIAKKLLDEGKVRKEGALYYPV